MFKRNFVEHVNNITCSVEIIARPHDVNSLLFFRLHNNAATRVYPLHLQLAKLQA